MPISILKELYICKTLDQLMTKADERITQPPIKSLIQTTNKLYEEAKKALMSGDEERSYILFYRYFKTIQTAKKSADYKKDEKYLSDMIGLKRLKEVLETMETLQSSLERRYDVLKEMNELRTQEINESKDVAIDSNTSNQLTNKLSSKSMETSDDNKYPVIDCRTLVESLENTTEMTKILILDIRSPEDYNDSHIDKLSTNADINVVNIPPNLLIPGITATKLADRLPFGNIKDLFSRRRSMSKVIIVDQHSHELIPQTPAFYLAKALWEWDVTSLKIKSKPFLMKGGYSDWILTYPMYTSNPHYNTTNKMPTNLNKKLNLSFNYDLNEFEDKPKKPDNHMVNGFLNGDLDDESQPKLQTIDNTVDGQSANVNNMFNNTRPTNAAIPGTAKPVIPDRSTKPLTQTNSSAEPKTTEVEEDFEKIKLRKLNEINENIITDLRDGYDKAIQTLQNELNNKNKENHNLMETVRKAKPASNVTNNTVIDKPVIAINGDTSGDTTKRNAIYLKGDESDDKENDELNMRKTITINGDMGGHRTLNNSKPSTPKPINRPANNLSVSSNMSRSLSSPNIAQLLDNEINGRRFDMDNEDDERTFTPGSYPQFDRTLKPAFNREKYKFYDSTLIDNKPRDFCPVHSAGQSITGLRNLGNTCFSNAVIQCLLNTIEFSSFFGGNFKINKNSKFGSNGELVLELAALFRQMAYPSPYKLLSAKDFRQAVSKHIPGFVAGAQQDSHEFLVKLFEKLHEDLNESTARDIIRNNTNVSEELSLSAAANKFWKDYIHKNNSIITQLFEGLIVQTLKCLTCQKTSNTFEVFSCLSLPLGNSRTTLSDCLDQYFKIERMSGEAAWECPTCKQKREADKKVSIWKLPKVLIVHLKRFSYEGRWKLSTYVDFPIDDLPLRTIQTQTPAHYSLYGVVNHFGTLEGGHYTAFSHNQSKYKWHRFDDQEITQTNTAEVKSQAAYILFYRCC